MTPKPPSSFVATLAGILCAAVLLVASPAEAREKGPGFAERLVAKLEQRMYARVNPARVPRLLRPFVDHWVNERGAVVGDPHAYLMSAGKRQPPARVTFMPSVFTRIDLWLHRNDVVRCDAGQGL